MIKQLNRYSLLFTFHLGILLLFNLLFSTSTLNGGVFSRRPVPKVLILIIASDDFPVYQKFQKIWQSYMNSDEDHIKAYFLKADPNLPNKVQVKGDTIWSKTEENLYPGILIKTIYALETFQTRLDDFDYIYRTNLSSFIIYPNLLKFLRTLPKKRCYAGKIDFHTDKTLSWACGNGIILSRDMAKLILNHKDELLDKAYFGYDDVILGGFFQREAISLLSAPRTDFYSLDDWYEKKKKIPANAFCIRTKCAPHLREQHDIHMHQKLLKRYYGRVKK